MRGIKDRLCSLAALRGTHHHGNGCAQQLFIQAKSALVLAVPVQKNRQGVQVQLVERQTCGRSEPEPDTGFDPLQIGKIQHCFIASKILRLFEFQRPQRHGVRGAELAGGLVFLTEHAAQDRVARQDETVAQAPFGQIRLKPGHSHRRSWCEILRVHHLEQVLREIGKLCVLSELNPGR